MITQNHTIATDAPQPTACKLGRAHPCRTTQGGWTIMEMMIVMAIILAITAVTLFARKVAWPWVQALREGWTVNAAMESIDTTYRGAPSFLNMTTSGVATSVNFDSKMLQGGAGTITNRWGGSVTVAPIQMNGQPNDTQEYTDPAVPGSVCTYLVSNLSDGADRISVGGVVVKPYTNGQAGPVDPNASAKQCDASTVSIVFDRVKINN